MAGIVFSGCSPGEQEIAKKFWKILGNNDTGDVIDKLSNGRKVKKSASKINDVNSMDCNSFSRFYSKAENRKRVDEDERFTKFNESKNETQLLLYKQRLERIEREETSKQTFINKENLSFDHYAGEEVISKEIEAAEAFKCIDEFEGNLKWKS